MLTGAMLGLMEQLGLDILTLTQELGEAEFFASRLTRMQTLQLLTSLAKTAAEIPEEVQARMSQIDWAAWAALGVALVNPSRHPLQIWVAIKELTPMTEQHLNEYRRTQPKLFSLVV